jgi:hypothetical protein
MCSTPNPYYQDDDLVDVTPTPVRQQSDQLIGGFNPFAALGTSNRPLTNNSNTASNMQLDQEPWVNQFTIQRLLF